MLYYMYFISFVFLVIDFVLLNSIIAVYYCDCALATHVKSHVNKACWIEKKKKIELREGETALPRSGDSAVTWTFVSYKSINITSLWGLTVRLPLIQHTWIWIIFQKSAHLCLLS